LFFSPKERGKEREGEEAPPTGGGERGALSFPGRGSDRRKGEGRGAIFASAGPGKKKKKRSGLIPSL